MIKNLKALIKWLKEYEDWYNAHYGPQTQGDGDGDGGDGGDGGPGSNPPTPPPPPPGTKP